ncbi:hypothetical protein LXL04_002777 [Taraxacum kok-saghyz]
MSANISEGLSIYLQAPIAYNVNVSTFRPFESTLAPPFDYNAFMASTNAVSEQQSADDDEEECTNKED